VTHSSRWLAALALSACAGALVLAAPQQVIRSNVDLVSLNVTVTNGDAFVGGLAESKFAVFEDGVKQDIAFFTSERQPIALSILLDSSTSMDQKLKTAQEAAVGFASRLAPQDVAQVIDFDSRPTVAQGFTNDRTLLEQAIRKTTAGGSTSLYNAIYIALSELKKVRAESTAQLRRQAIVVLSDGEDTSSLVEYDAVLEAAKRSDVLIYCIGLKSKTDFPTKGFNEADFVMRTLAQETGGRAFFVELLSQLSGVYQAIADELVSQYTIGYNPKNPKRDGAWRTIVVQVDHADAVVRTKRGYFAPTIQ
jgi:Ca-activated chloride channel family protein